MNEQIKKIAEQSGMVMYPTGLGIQENTIWGDRNITKFSNLLVTECINQVEQNYVGSIHSHAAPWNAAVAKSVNKIKEHFGVEESQSWVCPKCSTDRTKAACPQGHTAALTGDCPMYGVAQ